MNSIPYSRISTEDLLREFAHKAPIARSGWNPFGKDFDRSPEGEAKREDVRRDLQAIGEELRARKPIAQIRQQLFEHEDRDVRGWASAQFESIDPEWASATWSGLAARLPVREVLALRARAKKGPPARPTLREMTNEDLVVRFEDAGVRDYATRFISRGDCPRDIELHNDIIDEMMDVVDEIKARNVVAELLPLLGHPNVVVRNHAAHFCLPVSPERAVPVLESVVASRDPYASYEAMDSLTHWRSGKLR